VPAAPLAVPRGSRAIDADSVSFICRSNESDLVLYRDEIQAATSIIVCFLPLLHRVGCSSKWFRSKTDLKQPCLRCLPLGHIPARQNNYRMRLGTYAVVLAVPRCYNDHVGERDGTGTASGPAEPATRAHSPDPILCNMLCRSMHATP